MLCGVSFDRVSRDGLCEEDEATVDPYGSFFFFSFLGGRAEGERDRERILSRLHAQHRA